LFLDKKRNKQISPETPIHFGDFFIFNYASEGMKLRPGVFLQNKQIHPEEHRDNVRAATTGVDLLRFL
jgi:hypothetical protein